MKSVSTLLTTLLTVVALFALTGWQVTSETAAERLLGRLGASLIELDLWLPAHQEDIQLLAQDREDGVVLIRDLPMEITLPAPLVLGADEASLKSMITREMGRQLYAEGNAAFRENDGGEASLSVAEPVRWTVTLLGSGMHSFWMAVVVLTLLLALAAAASVMTTNETPVHSVATGALIGAGLSLAFWGLMQLAGSMVNSAANKEILLILKDGAWMGVRNCGGVAFAAGVLAFLVQLGRGHRAAKPYTPAPRSRTDSPF